MLSLLTLRGHTVLSWWQPTVCISLAVILGWLSGILSVRGKRTVTLVSRYSSQESTGMIARGKPSRKVVIRLSKQEESLLEHSLGNSARLIVTFHDGRNGTRMNVTRTGCGKGGIPKSSSDPDSLWSPVSRPYSEENGSWPEALGNKSSYRMPTRSASGTVVTWRKEFTGQDRSRTAVPGWNPGPTIRGSGNRTR